MLKEWPLVAFTIAGQMAVGIYVLAGSPLFLAAGVGGAAPMGQLRLTLTLVVLGLMTAATALSIFHLHHPARAFRALSNLRTSWLSREILFEIAFAGCAALLAFCAWRGLGGPALAKALFVLGGAAGVLFLAAMSRLYMLAAVPAWNGVHTPLSFVLSSLVMGALAASVFFGVAAGLDPRYAHRFLAAGLLLLIASAAAAGLWAPRFGVFGGRHGPTLRPPAGAAAGLHAVRLILPAAGAAVLALELRSGSASSAAPGNALLITVFMMGVAGEALGRFLFYADK